MAIQRDYLVGVIMDIMSAASCDFVFGQGEYAYQRVIEDFQNTSFIGVLTYNISPKDDSFLLNALKEACGKGVEVVLITNIPKRFPAYYGDSYAIAASNAIRAYLMALNPQKYGPNMDTYFLFKNHAKIMVTDHIAYWGSGNFSDESKNNFECGAISTDLNIISHLKNEIFPLIKAASVPYYRHNFIQAIYQLRGAVELCRNIRNAVFEASFVPWEDYDTGFETRWIYDTQNSGITHKLLEEFLYNFKQYEDALKVIDTIVDEYWEEDALPSDVEKLSELSENYKTGAL